MSDLIRRQDAIDAVDSETVSTNPEHFKSSEKFIKFMDDVDIASFGQWQWANGFNTALVATRVQLKKLPSAQPEPQWIPCNERMPEEDVEVLISYRYKEGEGDTSHVDIDITSYGQMYFGGREVAGKKHWRPPFEYFSSNYEVIAWMPLPEPYKMDGEENENEQH